MNKGDRNRTLTLTRKAWLALEMERRRREHPELDPVKDWVEIPEWMLNGATGARAAATNKEAGSDPLSTRRLGHRHPGGGSLGCGTDRRR
jgi:hypothetical protein